MSFVSPEIAALLQSQAVNLARLVEFDFVSGVMRVWQGFGPLVTADGKTWSGIGNVGEIQGLGSSIGGGAQKITIKVSGVDASFLALAIGDMAEVQGRDCTIYEQYFDVNMVPVGPPFVVGLGTMTTIPIDRQSTLQQQTRSCSVTLEGAFAGRARAPHGTYSDADQKARSPGDRFCEHIPFQIDKQLRWPKLS